MAEADLIAASRLSQSLVPARGYRGVASLRWRRRDRALLRCAIHRLVRPRPIAAEEKDKNPFRRRFTWP